MLISSFNSSARRLNTRSFAIIALVLSNTLRNELCVAVPRFVLRNLLQRNDGNLIIREIDHGSISRDDKDRANLGNRMKNLLPAKSPSCYTSSPGLGAP